jgi:hypothetical protein
MVIHHSPKKNDFNKGASLVDIIFHEFVSTNYKFNIPKALMPESAPNRFAPRGKQRIFALVSVSLVVIFCAIILYPLTSQRQSSLRLNTKLNLKQLRAAIEIYQNYYQKLPKDLEELKAAGILSERLNLTMFRYMGGSNGILAFQNEPFQPVKANEPWGGHGEVAKHDIPSARLVLFSDGSIEFIDESEFQKKFSFLLAESENGGIKDSNSIRRLSAKIEELIPGMRWSEWYQQESGYRPDPEWFGAWISLAVGNALYIGIGTGQPTLGDGALVARFDGEKIESIGTLAEEGIHEIIWDPYAEILHIAGTDPSWPDDWRAGNHYTYAPNKDQGITKHRDPDTGLINVIHTWGLWLSDDHKLIAAVNGHDGSFTRDRNLLRKISDRLYSMVDDFYYSKDYGVTRLGRIFRSSDKGRSWQHVGDLGNFRLYDIIEFNNKWYAIYTDKPELPCTLAVSSDGAVSWKDVPQGKVMRVNLTPFLDKLLAVSYDGESIYSLISDTLKRYDLPRGFRVRSHFNVLAADKNYLYAVCTRKKKTSTILRSSDLHNWEEVAGINEKVISLYYWHGHKWLVLSTSGSRAKLWKIDLKTLSD